MYKMPFHKRTVEPQNLCRFNAGPVEFGAGQSRLELDSSRVFGSQLCTALNDVSCTSLKSILQQLAGLSRHACSIFMEIQSEAVLVIQRSAALQRRLDTLQHTARELERKRIRTPVSSLDEESKWSVHYTAPWHQQENVFLPGSRPPCVEELHCQAKVNLKTVLRECDKLRKDGFRSSQYYSQGPTFSSPLQSDGDGQRDHDEAEKKKKSSESSEEEKLVYSYRPQTPYQDNINDISNLNSWSECLPLPTPEEKMKLQALFVTTDIVPINVTGENFDRQASFRRTTINTDTIIRRSKRVKRRKTITGVPDNLKRELASNEQSGIRSQSMKMTGQYSTLGDVESINSSLKHLVTRDSGCQTDDFKTVSPSVHNNCLQRSSGVTTQTAKPQLSSIGSNSNMKDCRSNIYTYQFLSSDQGFHSLPRQNSRICLQKSDAICTGSSYLSDSVSTSSLPYQVSMQHSGPESKHKSHTAISSYMASTHHSSTSSLNAGIVLQNTKNCSVHASQSFSTDDTALHSLSSCGTSCSASSSGCQSQASLHMTAETCSQCSTLVGRSCSPCGGYEDSDVSENSIYNCTMLTADRWTFKHAPVDQWTLSCSSPTDNACNSLELSPNKTDTSSLFSVDTEEYSVSMQLTPDHKSYSYGCINKAGNTRHGLCKFREQLSPDDSAEQSSHTLSRSISLRKAKKPPLPPKRTDSLQRKPQRKPYHNEKLHSEQLISSVHESTKSHSALYSGQTAISHLENLWNLCPRSQSSFSVASSEMSTPAHVCPATPTHSDSSSQHSEYTESWDRHMDYPHSSSEHGLSSQTMRPVFSKEISKGSNNNENPLAACINSGINSNMAAPAEKVQLMTSPSSGYSSQSNTPTAGTPVTVVSRTKSPATRPKPKVPERKSSLRSSVSPHSTPLSSNTPDFLERLPSPPPPPKTLPGLVTLHTLTNPLSNLDMSDVSPIIQSPVAVTSNSEEGSSSVSSTVTEQCKTSISPDSSYPSSEVPSPLKLVENQMSSPPLPPPPPLPHTPSVPPSVTTLKVTESLKSLDAIKEVKKLNYSQGYKPAKQERPVITAQALQGVHLRPIKLIKLENIFTDVITTVCASETQQQNKAAQRCTDKPVETQTVKQVVASDSGNPLKIGINTTDFLLKETTHTMAVSNPAEPVSTTHSSDNLKISLDTGCQCTPVHAYIPQPMATSYSSDETLQDKGSPTSPRLSNRSPLLHQPLMNGLEHLADTRSDMSTEPENINSMSSTDTLIQNEAPVYLEPDVESDSQNSTPLSPRRHSVSSEISSDSLTDTQLTGLTLTDHDLGLSDKDPVLSDKGIADDSLSSSSGSVILREEDNDENDAAFDSGTDSSSPTFSSRDNIEDMMTTARPRTIDDLFAAIHRSKRKVLGRCNFEKEHSGCFITSPPVSPTSYSPGINWMPQQSNTQRRLHRSTISNDSFKALLLKKGSRSDPGFRMSATEMLKCTDPRLQRSSAEASSPFSAQCASPGRSRRAYEEWACTEGVLPHLSPSLTHSKYGRASTPPCAASSRYNSRSRIPSGPMTVICERDGELAESVDCCNIPYPVSMSASETVCPKGST